MVFFVAAEKNLDAANRQIDAVNRQIENAQFGARLRSEEDDALTERLGGECKTNFANCRCFRRWPPFAE